MSKTLIVRVLVIYVVRGVPSSPKFSIFNTFNFCIRFLLLNLRSEFRLFFMFN